MIAPADLLTPHGARELAQLATPEGVPTLDPDLLAAVVRGEEVDGEWDAEDIAQAHLALATLQAAVDTANARINRVALGRVLSADEQGMLHTYALDIARWRLYDDGQLPELHPVLLRYREAVRFLERVADGREPLGQATAGTAGLAQASAPVRQFDADTLAAYR
ncbi:phage protein Gp36 family protein [Thiocystis violascens]|uniref:Mu-like prophage protein gp36 n=1 Tax=Thiocystis violascens (strain ATCC 17096 / DSM 198 / 6111) TaxID=765911 RepID=I3YGW7_THIV6|nr:phage protein Gp36 family protein [Thiocystis violascens]AFL76235.1 Mu-like prophage protein gp36 [Thiocystis violascens DSM 198]